MTVTSSSVRARSAPVQRLVLPVEGTSQELEVQQWALSMAASLEVPLLAVHVSGDAAEPPGDLFDYLDGLAAQREVHVEHLVVAAADVVSELVEELVATDLVVLGTRRLATGEPDSVAQALVQRAPCPVQVLRLQ